MARFNVYLYPVMVLHLLDIEAEAAVQAITKATDLAEACFLDSGGDCRQGPVFAEEFVRYVVDPVIAGEPDCNRSETYLDAAHLAADEKDRADGFPVYERL